MALLFISACIWWILQWKYFLFQIVKRNIALFAVTTFSQKSNQNEENIFAFWKKGSLIIPKTNEENERKRDIVIQRLYTETWGPHEP